MKVISFALFSFAFPFLANGQQLTCQVEENAKPFYSFVLDMKKSSQPFLDCVAMLTIEESDAYIGNFFKEVVGATYRQTTGCRIRGNEIRLNWVDGDIATLIVARKHDGILVGTLDFPYGVNGLSIPEETEFSVRCSDGELKF